MVTILINNDYHLQKYNLYIYYNYANKISRFTFRCTALIMDI